MKRTARLFVLAGFILVICLGEAAVYEFGSKVRSEDLDAGRMLEGFSSAVGHVTIGYWDTNGNGEFCKNDVLYLHFGPGSIRTGDIRLTPYDAGEKEAGTKVTEADNDVGKPLTTFRAPYPRIVYVDWGDRSKEYDLNDPVYVKTTSPIDRINIDDVRLSSTKYPAGSRVWDSHDDRDMVARLLHPGPNFATQLSSMGGQARFYNSNGNLKKSGLAYTSVYDSYDDVYFDISCPAVLGRPFGYVTPNAIRLSEVSIKEPPSETLNGNNITIRISGYVWNDLDLDGVRDDDDEPGVRNVTVNLHNVTDLIANTSTDETGYYLFDKLVKRVANGS